jgi:hypothetical protein
MPTCPLGRVAGEIVSGTAAGVIVMVYERAEEFAGTAESDTFN